MSARVGRSLSYVVTTRSEDAFGSGMRIARIAFGFLEMRRLRRGDLGWESAGIRIEV